jgi:hypothetical protein
MSASHKHTRFFLSLGLLVVMSVAALAADPGLPLPSGQSVNGQIAGNMLIYNLYTSSITDPVGTNTRINITNIDSQYATFVHFFFVDGSSCSVADSFICLTPNQTMTFLASDIDPGVTGYIIAIAVDSSGLPLSSIPGMAPSPVGGEAANQVAEVAPPPPVLIGDEYVKMSPRRKANLPAEATNPMPAPTPPIAPLGGNPIFLADPSQITLTIPNLPRVLAVNNITSRADGNDTLLIVNRIGGDLRSSAASIGSLFGIVYDQLENPYSWTSSGGCQIVRSLDNTFPRTTPRFGNVIPAGSIGWMKFWATSDNALTGTVINSNSNAGSNPSAFEQGHSLHNLRLTSATITIPVFPSNCS